MASGLLVEDSRLEDIMLKVLRIMLFLDSLNFLLLCVLTYYANNMNKLNNITKH